MKIIFATHNPGKIKEMRDFLGDGYEVLTAKEVGINEDYIESLVDAYNRYFFYYNDSPLLVVNTTDIDFVEEKNDLSNLVRKIRSIKGGVQHYIPLGSGR